jgi:hypothetical protein
MASSSEDASLSELFTVSVGAITAMCLRALFLVASAGASVHNNNTQRLVVVTATATKALTSPGVDRALTDHPVRQHILISSGYLVFPGAPPPGITFHVEPLGHESSFGCKSFLVCFFILLSSECDTPYQWFGEYRFESSRKQSACGLPQHRSSLPEFHHNFCIDFS